VLTSEAPASPTVTHSDGEAQLTLSRSSEVDWVDHAAAAGFVVVAISRPSTVTPKLAVGHDPDKKPGVVGLTDHALAPPAGSLEASTLSALSVTKH
jgi:hypothetical protein